MYVHPDPHRSQFVICRGVVIVLIAEAVLSITSQIIAVESETVESVLAAFKALLADDRLFDAPGHFPLSLGRPYKNTFVIYRGDADSQCHFIDTGEAARIAAALAHALGASCLFYFSSIAGAYAEVFLPGGKPQRFTEDDELLVATNEDGGEIGEVIKAANVPEDTPPTVDDYKCLKDCFELACEAAGFQDTLNQGAFTYWEEWEVIMRQQLPAISESDSNKQCKRK